MQGSWTTSLAAKLGSSVPQVCERFSTMIETEHGPRRVLEVRIERGDKPPLVAHWGAISLALMHRHESSNKRSILAFALSVARRSGSDARKRAVWASGL